MIDGGNELQKAFWRVNGKSEEFPFDDVWPTETRGDGKVVKNNARTGAAQGKSSLVRKAHCVLCGFINDLTRIDHSGGSIDAEGAGGAVTTAVASAPVGSPGSINGNMYTHTENYGSQAYRNASGCALCFSKNSTKLRQDAALIIDPWSRLSNLGF